MTKPYYEDSLVRIYHMSCEEWSEELVGLVLTDPPYGLDDKWAGGGGGRKSSWAFKPDEARSWDQLSEASLITRWARFPAVIWGGNNYPLPPSRCWFLWDKKQADTFTTGQAEMAWTNLDRTVRIFRMSQVEAYGNMDKKHPTQKPLSLITWCIEQSRTEGTILDPFMGSGTTLVAAKSLNRHAIGIEVEEKYCEIAALRCQQEVMGL